MGEPDFDDFIKQQKERLAKERQALADSNNNRVADGVPEGRRKWQLREVEGDRLPISPDNYGAATAGASLPLQTRRNDVPQPQGGSSRQDVQQLRPLPGSPDLQKPRSTFAAVGPVDAANAVTGEGGLFSGLGGYEKKRQALNEERKKDYNVLLTERVELTAKHDRQPSQSRVEGSSHNRAEKKNQNPKAAPAAGPSTGSAESHAELSLPGLRDRLSAEQAKVRQRNAEYNELLRNKLRPGDGFSSAAPLPLGEGDSNSGYQSSLPGLKDRLSAEQEKVKQRNAEYNDFLQQQQSQGRRQETEFSPRGAAVLGLREPSLILDDRDDTVTRGRPPLPPPGAPARNRGWGTPTYDEILEAKRRDEQAYRRYDDPEARFGLPLTGRAYARNAGSESDISKGHVDGGRVAREVEQRKVTFADDSHRGARDERFDVTDHASLQRRRSDPQSDKNDAPFLQAPAARYNSTLLIGREERASATRKKKESYRQELIAQMEVAAQAKNLERQSEISVNATGLTDPFKVFPGAYTFGPPSAASQPPLGSTQQYPPNVPYGVENTRRSPSNQGITDNRIDRYGYDKTSLPPASSATDLLDRGITGRFNAQLPPQSVSDTGYSRLSNNPYGNPIVLPPPAPVIPLPTFNPSVFAPSVGQYSAPGLAAAAAPPATQLTGFPYSVPSVYSQPFGTALAAGPYVTPSPLQNAAFAQQLPVAGLQPSSFAAPAVGFSGSTSTQTPHQHQQQQVQQPFQPSSTTARSNVPQQPSSGGFLGLGDERPKQPKTDYSVELQKQIEERKLAKQKEKEEQQRYEQKLEAEIAAYNPYGRGGGGAPLKDQEGNTVADRRTLKKVTGDGVTPRIDVIDVTAGTASVKPPPIAVALASAESNQTTDAGTADSTATSDAAGKNFARGGNGIFGEPKSDAQKTVSDRYKEELRLQIEEKKRKQDEERRRAREEEEREAARLEEERLRIQREFELEQQRVREKEEEAKKKNEDLIRLAEEKRKEAEKKVEEREKAEQQRREHEQEERGQRRQQHDEQPVGRRSAAAVVASAAQQEQPPASTTDVAKNKAAEPAPRASSAIGNSGTGGRNPAADGPTRLKSAEVLSQLAHMRRQLQQERLRVENALEKHKADSFIGSSSEPRAISNLGGNSGLDAFELARRRHGAPAASRRSQFPRNTSPSLASNAADEVDRLGTVPESPERSSSHLDSTSSFVLPAKPRSSNSLLDGETAFIDAGRTVGLSYPEDFEELRNQGIGDGRRSAQRDNQPPSARSIDPERITKKNQDRLKKLKQIAGDDMSVADPDDIIDRFMARHHKDRPSSGQTLEDDSWLKAGSR